MTKEKINELFWTNLLIFIIWVGVCGVIDWLDRQGWVISGKIIVLMLVSYWVRTWMKEPMFKSKDGNDGK